MNKKSSLKPPTPEATDNAAKIKKRGATGTVKPLAASKYSAPALEKGLDILEALADAPQGYTLNELAQLLGRTMSEIFRMAITLEARGWVHLAEGDRYALSHHMFGLANRHRPMYALVTNALPIMQDLSQKIKQSCHLSVAEHGQILIVAHVDAPGNFSFSLRTGAVSGFYTSGSGLALLAFRSAQDRLKLVTPISRSVIKTVPPIDFEDQLEKVRERGYAHLPSRLVKGVTDIAVPVFGRSGLSIAALAIPFLEPLNPANSPSIEEAVTLVQEAALHLSETLGYTGQMAELGGGDA